MAVEDLGDPEVEPQQAADERLVRPSIKCKICRGTSTGAFYGVPACRVCKGIFKRGIQKKFHCSFDNACDVRWKTKDRCKACLFGKCVRKGMVAPDAIVSTNKLPVTSEKVKPVKRVKVAKVEPPPPVELDKFKPDRPAGAPLDRYYEVKEDLKSLFEPSAAKPFRFFDIADRSDDLDEFAAPPGFGKKSTFLSVGDDEDEEVDDRVLPAIFGGLPPPPTFNQSFFFSPNDPRLAEGMRYLTLNDMEMAASLEDWKKIRPQVAADFKKLKKNANRKRKTFDR